MKKGLHEKILQISELCELERFKNKKIRKVDSSDLDLKVSLAYESLIRRKLNSISKEEKWPLLSKLNEILGVENFATTSNEPSEWDLLELLALGKNSEDLYMYEHFRPRTSLSSSTLFIGGSSEHRMMDEIRREIRTADEIQLLVSFIKHPVILSLYEDLEYFTASKPLKIITTTYVGATDAKAVELLSQLNNTEIKVSYDKDTTRLHAKAYIFKRNSGFSTAYIGSSNLSKPALDTGLEWNLKITEQTSKDIFIQMDNAFKSYWNHSSFEYYTNTPEENKKLKESLKKHSFQRITPTNFYTLEPFEHQKMILEDLEVERKIHNSYRNLVVAATGTGKTLLSAFDYERFCREKGHRPRLLFLAHRKEILEQSLQSFQQVLRDANFGELFVGGYSPTDWNHVFASVQSMNSGEKYKEFEKDYFDYIILDECHHSSAQSYDNILQYFDPQILLGLTATPERMDGRNILEFFNYRMASEIRLIDAINEQLLCPFHYYGIADNVDISKITFTKGKYAIRELEEVYSIHSPAGKLRMNMIGAKLERYITNLEDMKALGFCASISHAEEMAESFQKMGIPSIALHSKSTEEERENARNQLAAGEVKCIFTVDLFNEGVDIPEVNTVLFLRPTESATIFLQQLGRGLRKYKDKSALTVLDFIGAANSEYDFSKKFRGIIGKTKESIKKTIEEERWILPLGSSIRLEKKAMEHVLRNLPSSQFNAKKLKKYILTWNTLHDLDLNLKNFLEIYEISLGKFYLSQSIQSFRNLLFQCGMLSEYIAEDYKKIKLALFRFSQMDSRELLLFAHKYLQDNFDPSCLSPREKRLESMIYYTIWDEVPSISFSDSRKQLLLKNTSIRDELLDLIEMNLSKTKNLTIPYEGENVPLEIHAQYTQSQIFSAFGLSNEEKLLKIREGVYYISDFNTDLFFITIHKNEKDYLPSTMYKDFAINDYLFNWESQSITSQNSATGRRYIEDRSHSHKILLFVRDYKKTEGGTSPYIFLGNAKYHSHKGEKPIEFIWELEHPIPERIIQESELRAIS
ncbi:DUF3427 domain-containing protein [Peptoniphilus sp. KCTC 25270]|uniref:DUF3427 domain-containing protein n=1 Tax=Peptoniphilus sp. KCTC 25270 TaxID=2897414 RepID=UPI001E2FD3FE|nr:DUF3427 domain-containing protein [Peptoniphilus sp. KCTC 25270]MCD1147660.1 DUF3427 domain-containing protein [Peptoniphilus sp. KCTC 25270]